MTDKPAGEAMGRDATSAILREGRSIARDPCASVNELRGALKGMLNIYDMLAANSTTPQAGNSRDEVIYPSFIGLLTQFFFRAKCNNSETWMDSFPTKPRIQAGEV